jgi:hypothetical protein
MKKLFILFGLIGVIHVLSGFMLLEPEKKDNNSSISGTNKPMKPMFTTLDGNMFLAITTEAPINVDDGDVVEFVFDKRNKFISFHVNDTNQDVIDTGEANLFVMISNELALSLKSHRLQAINVIHDGQVYVLAVDSFWTPDEYLGSL